MEKISSDEKFIQLLEQYEKLIFSICYHTTNHYFDAEDLTQETFLSVYKSLESFDGQNEKAWITRIATNKCLDYMKRAERKSRPVEPIELEDSLDMQQSENRAAPENMVMENQVKEQFRILCKQLKEPYDKIAYTYFYEEKTPQEIAVTTGKNVKTVQTQIYRARSQLRKLWRKEDFL